MASPMATASAAKPLDPLRQGRYTVHLADGLISQPRSTGSYSSVRYNFKPKRDGSTSRESIISAADNDRFTLALADSSGDREAKHVYSGRRKNLKRSFALIFDQSNHTCTLEPLSSAYTFNVQSTPTEASASKLAEKYPKLKPKDELAREESATGPGGEEIDPNGSADESNPFDYRHYLRNGRDVSRSVSPDAARSATSTPRVESARVLPAQSAQLTASNARKQQKQITSKPRKSSPPVGTTLSKSRMPSGPSVRLDRRATARPAENNPAKKVKTQASKPAVKSDYYVHSDSDSDEVPAPVSDAGGLEIDFGDAKPVRPRSTVNKSKKGFALPGGTPGSGPISLRSAANSANASPAHRLSTPLSKAREDTVIDFGEISAKEDDDGGYDEDDEGDADVEPMTLGSPAHHTSNAKQDDDEDDDDDDDDKLEELLEEELAADANADVDADADADADSDLEQELMEGLASQEEEDNRESAVFAGQGYESEESEEE